MREDLFNQLKFAIWFPIIKVYKFSNTLRCAMKALANDLHQIIQNWMPHARLQWFIWCIVEIVQWKNIRSATRLIRKLGFRKRLELPVSFRVLSIQGKRKHCSPYAFALSSRSGLRISWTIYVKMEITCHCMTAFNQIICNDLCRQQNDATLPHFLSHDLILRV